MYSTTGQNTNGPMTQKAVTDALDVLDDISNNLLNEVYEIEETKETVNYTTAQHYNIDNSKGNLVYSSNNSAYVYYIPVVKGEFINVKVIFPQSRPIHLGVFARIAANEPSLQDIKRENASTFDETIKIKASGYLAMYIFVSSGYTPTTFAYSKVTRIIPQNSRIDELENDVAGLKESIGTRNYKTGTYTSGLYINENTGVLTEYSDAHGTQKGYYYPVAQGEHIYVDITLASAGYVRYGFISSVPPIAGDIATGMGAVSSASVYNFDLIVQSDGYFMATVFNGFSSINVYTKEGMTMQDVREELDAQQSDINELDVFLDKFKKPSYCSMFNLALSGTGSASALAQGQYIQSSIGVYSDDDMCGFKFTPNGSDFEIRFGKFANTGGTLFAVKKSSAGSQLITYKINDSGSYVTVKTETLPFTLLAGVEYYARIERYVYNNIIFVCTLTSNDGNYYQTTAGYSSSRGWGKYYIIAQTGSASNISIHEWSAYKKDCWLMFVGHSYVEGVSTEGFSENKFTKMMQEELGYKECAIMGMGGDTMSGVYTKFSNYIDVMGYRPKYAAYVAGANDLSTSYNNMITALQNFIAKCEANEITPILFTINPRYDQNNAQWNNVNTWIRQSGHLFVDMYYCFVDANGNAIADHYLDRIHPTEKIHKAIFQRMIEDVPQILNEQ
jgi:hypothetical protein